MKITAAAFAACLACASFTALAAPPTQSKKDTTPPDIVAQASGTMGNQGWYLSNVVLTWTVTDTESKLRASSGCGTSTLGTDSAGTTYTCSATSSGGTSSQSVTLKRDASLPTVAITSPAAGAVYAQGQSVSAAYACADALSGLASCTGNVANGALIDTGSAGSKTFTVQAVDQAGNVTSVTRSYSVQAVTTDSTAPLIQPVISGTLGSNGWYVSNVTLTWSVSDAESAVSAQSGCATQSITTNTAGTTYTCMATSAGGTGSQSVTIKRDTSAPTTSISSPGSGASYSQGQVVIASYACADSLSGLASCTGTVDNGSPIDTSTLGSQTFSVTAIDAAGNRSSRSYSYSVTGDSAGSVPGTYLFAWNDLGMHCADADYSVFTLLPPFNTLNAQLVVGGKLVSTGVELSYESAEDPDTLSINTFSRGKTNFWEYDESLFGVSLVPDVGLTGNPTASTTPAPLAWNVDNNWFEATGIPIMPVDDNYRENAYPLVKVTARDSSGTAIASSHAVLPVSSEINCNSCHASNTSAAAKPQAGWVNQTANLEKDWRLNILRLHDEKNAANANYVSLMGQKGYGASLESSAANGKPILCDTCHNSNALAVWGIVGVEGVSNMTAAMHNRHANTSLPGSSQTLDSITTRDACYNCHPGKNTQCLRGAMGNPVDSTGKHSMECQSCHGGMSMVGNRARNGWFDMPKCQSCHHDGLRETVAIKPDGTFKDWTDTRYASNPDMPVFGTSLFRFSTGHGKLQCEACHNSTHAEFTSKPSANGNHINDNRRAIEAQGYAAAIRECTVCHATMPSTSTGGPHGMHRIGQGWVGGHENVDKSGCAYCHGSSSAGSALAVIKVAKTFNIDDGRSKTFSAGERVTCWSCHNGPNP